MTTFDAIIFDMDGLLVDSETVWHTIETEMLAARGKIYDDAIRAQIIGLRMDEFVEKIKSIFALSETYEQLREEIIARMLQAIPIRVNAKTGADALVTYVMQKAVPRAIASSSPLAIIDTTVESRGWADVFTVRCSADDDARGKPAPDVYLRAAHVLGVNPARCLALEDSPNGARAAVAAGMTCYVVPDLSHTSPAAFTQITPHIYDDLHQVLNSLKMNGEK